MDLGAGHLTIIVGTGGGVFTNKDRPQGRAFEQFFQMPGVCPGGMLAAGIDSHITLFLCQKDLAFLLIGYTLYTIT